MPTPDDLQDGSSDKTTEWVGGLGEETPTIGRQIGRYTVTRKLGSGGMGEVYLARQPPGREVAIKVIGSLPDDPDKRRVVIRRFHGEASGLMRINHPNVVTVYAYEDYDDGLQVRPCLIMEYLDGRSLREMIGRQGRFAPAKAMHLVEQVLEGLGAIHGAGLIHRDLKPHNLIVMADGRLKIIDLGLVKDNLRSDELTHDGIVMGSPQYMAPEQFLAAMGGDAIDARADIYALGVVLFQLLTGKLPFEGKDARETFQAHQSAPIPEHLLREANVPQGLIGVVRKAMSKKPSGRYQSVVEMRRAIERMRSLSEGAAASQRLPRPKLPVRPPPIPAAARKHVERRLVTSRLKTATASRARSWKPLLIGILVAAACVVVLLVWLRGLFVDKVGSFTDASVPVEELVSVEKPSSHEAVSAPITLPTAADGCQAYESGFPGRAIEILKPLVNASSATAHLFCLCAAEHQLRREGQEKDCKAYLARADRDKRKVFQVNMWLKK